MSQENYSPIRKQQNADLKFSMTTQRFSYSKSPCKKARLAAKSKENEYQLEPCDGKASKDRGLKTQANWKTSAHQKVDYKGIQATTGIR